MDEEAIRKDERQKTAEEIFKRIEAKEKTYHIRRFPSWHELKEEFLE